MARQFDVGCQKHFLQLRDADFDRAAGACEKAAQQMSESSGTEMNVNAGRLSEMPCFPEDSATCQLMHKRILEAPGIEQPTFSTGKPQVPIQGGAKSGALDALRLPGPLADALLARWRELPEAVKNAVLGLLRQRP